jgi:acetyltransferase-like isoleucine patch superfamily enzyme
MSPPPPVPEPSASGLSRTLPWDWYPGVIPGNVEVDPSAYLETTFSFHNYHSRAPVGVKIGAGASTYLGTMFDVGPRGRVTLGRCALVHGARIICDDRVEIGDHAIISWNVVLMDSYRTPRAAEARPVVVEPNVWIGFDAVVGPGVRVGRGSIVGARSVVFDDVAPYTVVVGNPARQIRTLEAPDG